MALEAYVPRQIELGGDTLHDAFLLTLYVGNEGAPRGALTMPAPPEEGARVGPLIVDAERAGKRWHLEANQIEILRHTPVGCEFVVIGGLEQRPVAD